MIVFDIETIAHPIEQLRETMPAFDPAEVKCGNLKDAAKIAEKIEQARASHETDYLAKAALSAETASVACIGITLGDGLACWDDSEVGILIAFWNTARHAIISKDQDVLVGFNIHNFDLPFLLRRSWIRGVEVPQCIRKGRYFNDSFVDLMQVWACGEYGKFVSLARLCKVFGLPGKLGTGADFGKLWAEDRDAALAYCKQDVAVTALLAAKMGVK